MQKEDRLAAAKCECRRPDFNFLFFRTSFWLWTFFIFCFEISIVKPIGRQLFLPYRFPSLTRGQRQVHKHKCWKQSHQNKVYQRRYEIIMQELQMSSNFQWSQLIFWIWDSHRTVFCQTQSATSQKTADLLTFFVDLPNSHFSAITEAGLP
jgi:hypothetical protein